MAESPHGKKPVQRQSLSEKVGRRADRKRSSREQDSATAWFGLGMFGLVGWSVAIPSLIGIAVGLWLDTRWPGLPSWTLTFLIIGVGLGCLNAWYWIKQESRDE